MNKKTQNIHFIAIGGSIMHNLAIALHKQGHIISGSDDEIFDPAKTLLEKYDLLPINKGWYAEKITDKIDVIILGMHAKKDNPELQKAIELNIQIFSFPDYIYEQSLNKQRIVIAGSHGKTTITSIIMHVLKYFNQKFDYAVGAQVEGFDEMVKLSDAPIIVLEGDEYFTSAIDSNPKFIKYHHHIGLISGVVWDHINVFPTEEEYVKQFDYFADATPKAGTLIYSEDDSLASLIGQKGRADVVEIGYKTHNYLNEDGETYLINGNETIPIQLFGKHNLQNISGAMKVLETLGITNEMFYSAIISFKGAKNRLEVIYKNNQMVIFKDYAHAPSKVKATTLAVKEQFPDRDLVACLELHTFSALNKQYMSQFKDTMRFSNVAIVYYNPQTIEKRHLAKITKEEIISAFNIKGLTVFDDSKALLKFLKEINWSNKNLLMMSSGTFDNMDFNELKDLN